MVKIASNIIRFNSATYSSKIFI